jgi:uncharacterized NAD(P)/FAD-binding protein YdhS
VSARLSDERDPADLIRAVFREAQREGVTVTDVMVDVIANDLWRLWQTLTPQQRGRLVEVMSGGDR